MGRYGARCVEAVSGATVELSPTSSQTSVNNRMTPTPLKLNNIGMLLRQLQHNDEVSRFIFIQIILMALTLLCIKNLFFFFFFHRLIESTTLLFQRRRTKCGRGRSCGTW